MKPTRFKPRIAAPLLSLALAVPLCSTVSCAASEYDRTDATKFSFSDTAVSAADGRSTGYKVEGTDLTIQSEGVYVLSGSCKDGSVVVKKGVTGVVLILDGLTLGSSDTAPITCNKSSEVTIVVADGTTNTLTDAAYNNDETYPDNALAENAVIKCKDGSQVTLCGSGTLNIRANGKNGVKSGETTTEEGEAWMVIQDVTLNVDAAVNDGINAGAKLSILSGNVTVSAADDGIHSDYVLEIGAAETEGPSVQVAKSNEGLEAAELTIFSGDIEVHATDDGVNAANSDLKNYAFSLTIAGGNVYVDAENGDGLDSNGTITISGGTTEIYSSTSSGNEPLDSDGGCTISGGTVLAVGSYGMGARVGGSQPYVTFGSAGRGGMADMGGRKGQTGGLAAGQNAGTKVSAGSVISIQDSSGNTLYTGKAVRDASYVLFSSPSVVAGDSYNLYSGNSSVATGTAGTAASGTQGQPDGGMQGRPDGGMQGRPGSGIQGKPGGERPGRTEPQTKPDNGKGNLFSDVSERDWFYSAVAYIFQNNLMKGTSASTFSPDASASRGMIVTILHRLDGTPEAASTVAFRDIAADAYYADAARWCAENGIVTGYGNDTFAPNADVTREQLAVILYRYAGYKNYDTSVDTDLTTFEDHDYVSDYAKTAMAWANQNRIMTGTDNSHLSPKDGATRAEVAAVLMRFCENATV